MFVNLDENASTIINHPIAQLITKDETRNPKIQHANILLYNFLEIIEQSFVRNCENLNVYDTVVNEITQKSFNFPCVNHATEILAYIVHYYLQFRMRQYANDYTKNLQKKSSEHKKLAKLYST